MLIEAVSNCSALGRPSLNASGRGIVTCRKRYNYMYMYSRKKISGKEIISMK